MAWFRMMGIDSVEYHRRTVLGREDDHAGSALAYYGSRGETPLQWGGKLAPRLGLVGAVDDEAYEAIYGRGGATDPILGHRLVETTRPGVELVIAAHKSVAVLGVIGRADDMHALLDAETDATLEYLEEWFEHQGGRRGKHHYRTATGGLLWSRTRHATSRAGDPAPHDHVLVANLTEMLDDIGGWRALDTAALRDLVHAATMVGRQASAALAVELGYGVVRDDGPSGKLGHWKIAGVPQEVMDVLSKRSEEIDLAMESSGYVSHRARGVAARETRAVKTDEPPDQLLPRWINDVESVGWPAKDITAEIVDASASTHLTEVPTDEQLAERARVLLGKDGELGRRKAFTRQDVVRVVAPSAHGLPRGELLRAVRAVIDHHDAIPLAGRPGARSRAWAGAEILATEQALTEVAVRLTETAAASAQEHGIAEAIAAKEATLHHRLTDGQRQAVIGVCASGRALYLMIGVAGAGKTTALDVVRSAFERDGFRVLGAATSGQAARTLQDDASVTSRTVASMLARLRTGSLTLDPRTVVVLDEAGMTDDASMLAVLMAVERAGAKAIVIGDHRQLGAVAPGGGLEALVERNPRSVHVLDENVRQHDLGERRALARLRDGDVDRAISWYRASGRIVTAPTRDDAIRTAVDRWHADVSSGHTTLLLAWRRADVAALNLEARDRMRGDGLLGDREHEAPGGRRFSAGDRVVALAASSDSAMTTSERGFVVAVDDAGVVVRSDAGRTVRLEGEAADAGHLDYGYAVTVHRAQGATVDRTHVLGDGGGRELAYVAMSRARESSHVHVVADDVEQAVEDLRREWRTERRDRWVLDLDAPLVEGERPQPRLTRIDASLRAARHRVEHAALQSTVIDAYGAVDDRDLRLRRMLHARLAAVAPEPVGPDADASIEL